MKHKNNIKTIAIIAFSLSIFGFIIDLDELDPNIAHNILDIIMMMLIIFGSGLFFYALIVLSVKIIKGVKL